MVCERKQPRRQRLQIIIILALFATLGFAPSLLALTETLPLTTYEILLEADYSGEKTNLYFCSDKTLIKSVPATFARDLAREGMGKLLDGRTVLDEENSPQCADVFDKNKFPYGVGSVDNPLAPFVSVASSSIPFGSTAFIHQLQNLTLPNGQMHNGCVRSDDTCDDSQGDCLVLYTYKKNETLRGLFPTVDITSPSACTLLAYSVTNVINAAPSPPQLPAPQTSPSIFPSPGWHPSSAPVLQSPPPSKSSKSRGTSLPFAVSLSLAGGALLVILLCGCVVLLFLRRFRQQKQAKSEMFDGLQVYSYAELQAATSGFRDILGDGASAQVYRAQLDGRVVAVKKLKKEADRKSSHKEFTAEARGLGQMIHVNLVRLLGYSNDENRPRMLVYEFVNGGTLESLLHGTKSPPISFERRLSIALGIALGIEYCHHSVETSIIHRDIKPANILMTAADETGIPKVADFGLARLLDPLDRSSSKFLSLQARLELQQASQGGVNHKSMDTKTSESSSSNSADSITVEMPLSFPSVSINNAISPAVSASSLYGSVYEHHALVDIPQHHITCVAGTLGYIDPEYLQNLHPTLKSDVYSFGIVLLELIIGQRPPGIYSNLCDWRHEEVENTDSHHLNIGGANTYELLLGGFLKRGEDVVASKVSSMLCEQHLEPRRVFEAVRIASLCLQNQGRMRPSMRKVVRMLEKLHESRDKENQTTTT